MILCALWGGEVAPGSVSCWYRITVAAEENREVLVWELRLAVPSFPVKQLVSQARVQFRVELQTPWTWLCER